MQTWFKMGIEILNCPVMRELSCPIHPNDPSEHRRQMAFIYLLSITATGAANDIQDAADLARIVNTTQKQAQIVWDICIKHGVLRKGKYGYSAQEWMIERGILGDFRQRRTDNQPQSQSGPQSQQSQYNPYQKRDSNDFG